MSRFRFKPILWAEDGAVGSPYSPSGITPGQFRTTDPELPRVNEIFQDNNGNTFIHKVDSKGKHRYADVEYTPSDKDKIYGRYYKDIVISDQSIVKAFWRITGDVDILCTNQNVKIFDITKNANGDAAVIGSFAIPEFSMASSEVTSIRAVRLSNGALVIGICSASSNKVVFYKVAPIAPSTTLSSSIIWQGVMSSCVLINQERAVFAMAQHTQSGTGHAYYLYAIAFAGGDNYSVQYVVSQEGTHVADMVAPDNTAMLIEGEYKNNEEPRMVLFAAVLRTSESLVAHHPKVVSISTSSPSDFLNTSFYIYVNDIKDSTQRFNPTLERIECYFPTNNAHPENQIFAASSFNGDGNFVVIGNDGTWVIKREATDVIATKHSFTEDEIALLNKKRIYAVARGNKSVTEGHKNNDALDNLYVVAAEYTDSPQGSETSMLVLSVNEDVSAISKVTDESFQLSPGCSFVGSEGPLSQSCNGLHSTLVTRGYRESILHVMDISSMDSDLGRAAKVHVLNAIYGVFKKVTTTLVRAAIGQFDGLISKTADIEDATIDHQVSEKIETEDLKTKGIDVDGYEVNNDLITAHDRYSPTVSNSVSAYEFIEQKSSKVFIDRDLCYALLTVRAAGLATPKTRLEISAFKDDSITYDYMHSDAGPKLIVDNISDDDFANYGVGRSFLVSGDEEDKSLLFIPTRLTVNDAIAISVYEVGFDTAPSFERSFALNSYGVYSDFSNKMHNIGFQYQDGVIWVLRYVGMREPNHRYILFKYNLYGQLLSAESLTGTISGYQTSYFRQVGLIRTYGSVIFSIFAYNNYGIKPVVLRFETGHSMNKNGHEFSETNGYSQIDSSLFVDAIDANKGFSAISSTTVLVDSLITSGGTCLLLDWIAEHQSYISESVTILGRLYGEVAEKTDINDPRFVAFDTSIDNSTNNCSIKIWDGFSDNKERGAFAGHTPVRRSFEVYCTPYYAASYPTKLILASMNKEQLVMAILSGKWATTMPDGGYCVTMVKLPINITCATFDQFFGGCATFGRIQAGSLLAYKTRVESATVGSLSAEHAYTDNLTPQVIHYPNNSYTTTTNANSILGIDTPAAPFKTVLFKGGTPNRSMAFYLCTDSADFGLIGDRCVFRNENADGNDLIIGYKIEQGTPKEVRLPVGETCEFVKTATKEWSLAGASSGFLAPSFSSLSINKGNLSGPKAMNTTSGNVNSTWQRAFSLGDTLVPGGTYDLSFRFRRSDEAVDMADTFSLAIGGYTRTRSGSVRNYVILGGSDNAGTTPDSESSAAPTLSDGVSRILDVRYVFTIPMSAPADMYLWMKSHYQGPYNFAPAFSRITGAKIC